MWSGLRGMTCGAGTIACLGLGMVLSGWEASAGLTHPFHTSIAEVDWNGETGAFEVALSLWPLDVEALLRQQTEAGAEKTEVDLDDPQQRDEVDRRLREYVFSKFRLAVLPAINERQEDAVSAGREPSKYEWLGSEFEKDAIWVYFRVIPSAEVMARLPQGAPEGLSARERRAQRDAGLEGESTPADRRERREADEVDEVDEVDEADAVDEARGRGVVRMRLRDEVLIEVQPEQRNTVTLRIAGRRETFEFNGERGSRTIDWPITWER